MTDLLRRRLAHHLAGLFDRFKVVVWEDDSGALGPLLGEALPEGVQMPPFVGNPLSLRHAVDLQDPWLERKWLLYLPPLPDGVETEWLADFEQGFHHQPQANLAWAFREFFGLSETPSMRALLKGPVSALLADQFQRYFGEGVDRLTEENVIFGLLRAAIVAPEADEGELILRFLVSPQDEQRWEAAGLLPSLTALVKSRRLALKRHLVDAQPPDRATLCRCLLASALVETGSIEGKAVANHLPDAGTRPLWRKTLEQGLSDPSRRDRLLAVLEAQIEGSDLLQALDDPLRLASAPDLPFLDLRMQWLLYQQEPSDPKGQAAWWERVRAVAEARLRQPRLGGAARREWTVLRDAADLLLLARERQEELTGYPAECFERLVSEYSRAGVGDWRLDALYRSIAQEVPTLYAECRTNIVEPARAAYHQWTREHTRRFVKAVEVRQSYQMPKVLPHTRFWSDMVDTEARPAVLIIDALRADLAWSLADRLRGSNRQIESRIALAELPTRTEVGMAALLPQAQEGFAVRVEQGRLIPSIGTTRLPSVTERTRYLHEVTARVGKPVSRQPVEAFLDPNSRLLADCFRDKKTPLAHTTDVDEGGEIAAKVDFGVFDSILDTCARFVEQAFRAGFAEVLVAGDHGFLVRDPQAAPGGVPGTESAAGGFARGLRYAAGNGSVGPELLRLEAKTLGRGGDSVYVPRDSSCLALPGGAGLFIHGGLSAQECVLVFLRVTPGVAATPAEILPVSLKVPPKATALTFRVTIAVAGVRQPLFVEAREVQVRIEDAGGKAVYSGEMVRLAPSASEQAVALTVTVSGRGEYSVSLYEAATDRLLMRHSIQIEVMGDDFGL